MFIEKDASLIEINPLILTKENNIVCLDAKVILDDNAFLTSRTFRFKRFKRRRRNRNRGK